MEAVTPVVNGIDIDNNRCQNHEFCHYRQRNYGSVLPETEKFVWPSSIDNGHTAQPKDSLTVNDKFEERTIRRRIWINICLGDAAIFLLLMGVAPVSLIQSSLNSSQGLGVISMAVKNFSMMIGSIMVPWVIHKIGCKSALVVGSMCYVLYVPANFYASWYTLIPMAVISGFGKTLKDVAYKVYVARLAHLHADITSIDVDRINSRIFVLYVISMQTGVSLGNIVISLIMRSDDDDDDTEFNASRLAMCGVNYCNQELVMPEPFNYNDTTSDIRFEKEDDSSIYMLLAFCTISGLLGVVMFAFQDPLKKFGISSNTDQLNISPMTALKELLIAMKDPRHILFIPLIVALFGGDTFWNADFNKGFITCSIGASYLGYVWAYNGIIAAFIGIFSWFVNKSVRSLPVVCATLLQLTILIILFYWVPSSTSLSTNYWTLSVFTIIYLSASSIRHFITPVLVSVVFKDSLETAFSVFHFWSYLSATVFYAWSSVLCISIKMYILVAIMPIAFIAYICMEILVHRSTNYRDSHDIPLIDDNH